MQQLLTATSIANNYNNTHLYFNKYTSQSPAVIRLNLSGEMLDAFLKTNFDFDYPRKNYWRFHLDITLDIIPYAENVTRSSFTLKGTEKEIFHHRFFTSVMLKAIKYCSHTFNAQVSQQNLCLPPMPDFAEDAPEIAAETIRDYFIRKNEILNNPVHKPRGFKIMSNFYTGPVFHHVFKLMDAVLYNNLSFNNQHNREVFGNVMPLYQYHTLQIKLSKWPHNHYFLSIAQTMQLIIILDCALQLAFGSHENTIKEYVFRLPHHTNMDKFMASYTEDTTYVFNSIKKSVRYDAINAIIPLPVYDWNALIK